MHPLFHKAKSLIKHFHNDSLYRNSIYLMLSNFVMAGFGFFFWIINTKLFTTEQIGIATAMISSITLITSFSLVGMNLALIRYLPKSLRKNDKINTVLTLVLFTTLIITIIYILGLEKLAPQLVIIRKNTLLLFFFILVSVCMSLESILGNIFVAYRDTKYILVINTIKSVIKMLLPIFLVWLGSIAIFFSATLGTIVGIAIYFYILYRVYEYNLEITFKKDLFQKMYKLSFGNYIASLLAGLPLTVLPIMITNVLGPKQTAYYYIDATIVSLLNTIQSSVNNSLFAEGSNDSSILKNHIIRSIKLILSLLLPAIFIIFFFGDYILRIFGKEFSIEGFELLKLLVLSVIFTSINGTLSSILNVKGKVNYILLMCIIGPVILMTAVYFTLPMGLISLGYGWVIGEAAIAIIYSLIVFKKAL